MELFLAPAGSRRMARYERTYSGERRTAPLRVQLTPSERAELEEAAAGQGAPNLSTFARELLFQRSAAVVAGTRRNPQAKALLAEINAIGNNVNQLARQANTTGELPALDELRAIRGVLEAAVRCALDL
jgi:Mobilization protein NikA